jgi:hypothetical protein
VEKSRFESGTVRKRIDGQSFFMEFLNADCERICVENPVPSKIYNLPRYTQTIQPYEFGHPYSKRTCLWLKNLPKLVPTETVEPIGTFCPSGSYSKKHDCKHRGVFTKDRAKNRSKTFPGIARAMAEQWGKENPRTGGNR